MFYTALLLLLPAVAYAQISIRVEAESNSVDSYVVAGGDDVANISDTERRTWQISGVEQMKDVVLACTGTRPEDVFFRRNPLNKLHEKHGFPVHRILRPYNGTVLNLRYDTVVLATADYVNNTTDTIKKDPKIRQFVEETVSTTWTADGELTVGHEINYEFHLPTLNHNFLFHGPWGLEATNTKTYAVTGSDSGLAVTMQPGEALGALLTAAKGVMEVEVKYRAVLDGRFTYVNEKSEPNERNIRHTDLHECLTKGQKRAEFESSVVIKYAFYADPQLVVYKKVVQKPHI